VVESNSNVRSSRVLTLEATSGVAAVMKSLFSMVLQLRVNFLLVVWTWECYDGVGRWVIRTEMGTYESICSRTIPGPWMI
jgi:hypothetical protein